MQGVYSVRRSLREPICRDGRFGARSRTDQRLRRVDDGPSSHERCHDRRRSQHPQRAPSTKETFQRPGPAPEFPRGRMDPTGFPQHEETPHHDGPDWNHQTRVRVTHTATVTPPAAFNPHLRLAPMGYSPVVRVDPYKAWTIPHRPDSGRRHLFPPAVREEITVAYRIVTKQSAVDDISVGRTSRSTRRVFSRRTRTRVGLIGGDRRATTFA